MTYNNSLITCTPHATPDPFVTHANGKFYLVCNAPHSTEGEGSSDHSASH